MEKEEAIRKVGSGSIVIAAGMVLGLFISYLFKVVAARFLGPDIYGVYAQAFAVVQATSVIALLGMHQGLPRFMSYHRGRGEMESARNSVMTAGLLFIPSAAFFSLMVVMASDTFGSILGDPRIVSAIRLFSIAVIPFGLLKLINSTYRGFQDAGSKVIIEDLVEPSISLVVLAVLLGIGMTLEAAIIARILGAFIAVIVGAYILRRRLSYDLFESTGISPRKLLMFSWPLFMISVFAIVNRWYGVLFIGFFKNSSAAGIFEVVISLAGTLVLFLGAISYMFMPVISELYGKNKINEIAEIYSVATRWIVTLVAPLFIGMIVFPGEIIELLFGAEYVNGAAALSVLAIGYFFNAVAGPGEMVLVSTGRTKRYLASVLMISIPGIGAAVLLIPVYGLVGAAYATALGVVTGNIMMLWYVRKELGGLPYNQEFMKLSGVILSLIPVLYAVKNVLKPDLAASLAIGAVFMVLYGLGIYLVVGIKGPEREVLDEVWRDLEHLISNLGS